MRFWVVQIALLGAAAAALARPGKVVRVEREQTRPKRPITVCGWMGSELTCFIGPVEVGDELELVDENAAYQRVEVIAVKPNNQVCPQTPLSDAKIRVLEKRGGAAQGNMRRASAFAGIDLRPGRSKLLQPNKVKGPANASGQLQLALDATGDGRAELAATVEPNCAKAQRLGQSTSRRNRFGVCITVWHRPPFKTRWREVGESVVVLCGP